MSNYRRALNPNELDTIYTASIVNERHNYYTFEDMMVRLGCSILHAPIT